VRSESDILIEISTSGTSQVHYSSEASSSQSLPELEKSILLQPIPTQPDSKAPRHDASLSKLLLRRLQQAHTTAPHNERSITQMADTKIFDLYHWDHVIQESGDGGKVVVCRSKSAAEGERKEFVMKMRAKQEAKSSGYEEHFRKSLQKMLNLPSHPGVMALHEVLEDSKYYYTVMEKADGGPLFQSLLTEYSDGVIPATVIKRLIRQILEGLGHLHRHGMLHRDIKPDNIVVHKGVAMLIDFDHVDADWDPAKPKHQDFFVGTVRFSAPEAFNGYFSQQSDLYSVGVLLYLLMSGTTPRDDSVLFCETKVGTDRWGDTVYKNLKQAPGVDWQCDPWPTSPACADLCRRLLRFYPDARPESVEDALAHWWLTDETAA